jgi:integrase
MKLRRMPVYERDASGQRIKRMSAKFYAVWVDYSGQLRRLPLFQDRKASEEMSRKIDRMNSLRAGGETLPPELSRFVETMPARIRERLAEWGIISPSPATASKPLAAHLDDWKAALLAKGNTERHAELVTSRARKAFDACGFRFWTEISASRLQARVAALREGRDIDFPPAAGSAGRRVRRGICAQTYNFYLQAAKQFCRWMVRDGRASESPLAHLQGVNVKGDRRHDRRPLSADELRSLLDATEHGPARFGMTGEARSLLYRLAVETGLRAGELRSLTRASFILDGDEPSVTIAAAYAKNRRQDTLPLRRGTAKLLSAHFAVKAPAAIAFNMPVRTEVIRMWRADLADARRAWLEICGSGAERRKREESSFLVYQDDAGRVADFHALRHTFISNLANGGVHPKTAQALARHSTITLTMDRYTHVRREDFGAALDVLPDLSQPAIELPRATGTLGCLSPSLRHHN